MTRKTWLCALLAVMLGTIGCGGVDPHEQANEVIDTGLNQYAELETELMGRYEALRATFDNLGCPPLRTRERQAWQQHISVGERTEVFNLRVECTNRETGLRRGLTRPSRIARLFNEEEINGVREVLRTRLATKEAEQVERVLEAAETAEGTWRGIVNLATDGQDSPWREPAYYRNVFDEVEQRFATEKERIDEIVARFEELRTKGESAAAAGG